jgi:hypothetical protein
MAKELTEDERAELDELRANRDKDNAATKAEEEKQSKQPNTHWLHLANGDVVESKGVASHIDGIQVIGSYEIPAEKRSDYKPEDHEHQF